jgi:hypothetical protein
MRNGLGLAGLLLAVFPAFAGAETGEAGKRARAGAFDAAAEIRCAQEVGQALGTCRAEVARAGGCAAVVVTFANGFSRTLYFEGGAFRRGNATMSGVGTDTDWRLSEEIHRIRVDDQRFEIPAALVLGE